MKVVCRTDVDQWGRTLRGVLSVGKIYLVYSLAASRQHGVDGIFPKGYRIGRVEQADRGSGLYRTITVRPGVDFSSLEEVLVVLVPPTGAARGEDAK